MNCIKLVSIIVPVYGVEAYLSECVKSLLAQTYQNLEIILIDDSSPDGCPQICDHYAQQDIRVKVLHKPNGGAASARNAGLEVAAGDYICFVDADDVAEKDYVQHLVKSAQKADADIAVCGYYDLTKQQRIPGKCQSPGLYSQTEYLSLFLTDWACALLWNKIYRRQAVGSLRMSEGHKIDDEFFTYRIVMNSQKVVVTDAPLYGYRLRVSSVMHDAVNTERIMLDRIEYTRLRYADIAQRYPALEPAFLQNALDAMTRYWRSSKDMVKAQKQIRKWVKEHLWKILKTKMPLRMKVAYLNNLYLKKPKALPMAETPAVDTKVYFD